jgi:DnaK suppressor protein
LEAKRASLMAVLDHREEITVEKAPDEMDNLQLAAQRELAISYLHMESSLLRSIRAALSRIEGHSYGICLHCEKPISPKRLQAVPWAAYCVRCQEAVDRGEVEKEVPDEDSNLQDAA